MYLWVEVPGDETSEACAERLLRHGVVVAPGSYLGDSGEGYVRIALVPTLEECERAAAILEERSLSTDDIIAALDRGEIRVAERSGDDWVVNEEAKAAILDYFRNGAWSRSSSARSSTTTRSRSSTTTPRSACASSRPRSPGTARSSRAGVVMMPSYVNIGAWVGPRTMIDTWATVGSCAQIGADVHLAGGVGIGGVLEPSTRGP